MLRLMPSRRLFLRRSAALTVAGSSAAILSASGRVEAAATPAREVRSPLGQAEFFGQIRQHEADHVAFLVDALGADARPMPTFQNLEQKRYGLFVETSQALENTGVGAYLGAAPYIDSMEYLADAGSILTVEARHAGYLNYLNVDPLTGNATTTTSFASGPSFDAALTAAEVVANAQSFIADLNGGPELTYSTIPSPDNDIAILNFALALEYLESAFYDANVGKFFPAERQK